MSDFPMLKTGAIVQYPAKTTIVFRTQIVRFADGSEQRFKDYGSPLRRWSIQLDLLDESEINRLREFFRLLDGAARSFSFTDPGDGSEYPNCSFVDEVMIEGLMDESKAGTSLTIRENRG